MYRSDNASGVRLADPASAARRSDLSTPRVIEIGEVTAGIVVPEDAGLRFFASARTFDQLEGVIFRSVEQAFRVARDRLRGGGAAPRTGA